MDAGSWLDFEYDKQLKDVGRVAKFTLGNGTVLFVELDTQGNDLRIRSEPPVDYQCHALASFRRTKK